VSTINVTWKLEFKQNYLPSFSPTVPPFAARISHVVWTWRHLAAVVGTSKPVGGGGGQVCILSIIGWSAAGAYAPSPDGLTICLVLCSRNTANRIESA
jgi:hypothetical protein